jgi:hypothetical protein
MNERIRELIISTGIHDSLCDPYDSHNTGNAYGSVMDDLEKFALLIVQECMRMCEVAEMSFVTHDCDVEASGAITVKQFIAEHFGVDL